MDDRKLRLSRLLLVSGTVLLIIGAWFALSSFSNLRAALHPDDRVGTSLRLLLTFMWVVPLGLICWVGAALISPGFLKKSGQKRYTIVVRAGTLLVSLTTIVGIVYWFVYVFSGGDLAAGFPSIWLAIPIIVGSSLMLLGPWLALLGLLVLVWRRL